MKQIAIMTYEKRTADFYAVQILRLFQDSVNVTSYAVDAPQQMISADVVLVSTHSIYALVENQLKDCRHVIIADITLKKESVEKLRALPADTEAMLVNTTMEMAVETIALIYNSGVNHIKLFPVYPGIAQLPDVPLAITPGEPDLVPDTVREVIDLHDRVLSMRTIANLAAKLNLTALLKRTVFKSYFSSLAQGDLGLKSLLDQVNEQEKKLDLVMQIFDGGILSLTVGGHISFINAAAEKLLGVHSPDVIGNPLEAVAEELLALGIPDMVTPLKDKVLMLQDQLMGISVYPLIGTSSAAGFLILIKTLNEMEQEQYKIRRQIISKGHVAKYHFSDILTKNKDMQRIKETARRMARSTSSIVIYGKSGTGKELFAQSIHNASDRRDYPFIAINCASIPETLLESELFGYSEGAFTGAKKGGKIGYFELAHKGTLFLDEISEMNLGLQARILRVLQEKEVIRIGGDSVVSIDVRIISASNKRLLELVRQNRFREDIYYRLNVLSLEIPPLCERPEDIALLLDAMKGRLNASFTITPDAMEMLTNYPWNGNVRELENFVKRASYLGKQTITLGDAQSQLDAPTAASGNPDKESLFRHFLTKERPRLDRHREILELLSRNRAVGARQGRHGISESLRERGVPLSQQEVRTLLHIQHSYGFVAIQQGRGGTGVTPLGLEALAAVRCEMGI